jgi:hypothetical protein
MANAEITKHARAIATKAAELNSSIVIPIVISLLERLLPKLFTCLADNDDVDALSVKARVEQLHERSPKRLRKRIAKNIISNTAKTGNPPTLDEAYAMADATIAHILESDYVSVAACCNECGPDQCDDGGDD